MDSLPHEEDIIFDTHRTRIERSMHRGQPCIIKYATRRYLSSEIASLKKLRGCKHVPKLLAYRLSNTDPCFIKIPILEHRPIDADQLYEAIREIHAHGIAHLDIKPENIMYDSDTLVLIDFANSLPFDEIPNCRSAINATLHYNTPEYLMGLPNTQDADFYAAKLSIEEEKTGVVKYDGRYDNGVSVRACVVGQMYMDGLITSEMIRDGTRSHRYFTKSGRFKWEYLLPQRGKAISKIEFA